MPKDKTTLKRAKSTPNLQPKRLKPLTVAELDQRRPVGPSPEEQDAEKLRRHKMDMTYWRFMRVSTHLNYTHQLSNIDHTAPSNEKRVVTTAVSSRANVYGRSHP